MQIWSGFRVTLLELSLQSGPSAVLERIGSGLGAVSEGFDYENIVGCVSVSVCQCVRSASHLHSGETTPFVKSNDMICYDQTGINRR